MQHQSRTNFVQSAVWIAATLCHNGTRKSVHSAQSSNLCTFDTLTHAHSPLGRGLCIVQRTVHKTIGVKKELCAPTFVQYHRLYGYTKRLHLAAFLWRMKARKNPHKGGFFGW